MSNEDSRVVFQQLKICCVPLLGDALLTPANSSRVAKLLKELKATLLSIEATGFALTPSLVSYTFFPLSTILQRNQSSDIPDQVLENLLSVLALLCETWWWTCDLEMWSQLFRLCGGVVGGIDSKGKGKSRDDETKTAAVQCIHALTHPRLRADARLLELQSFAQKGPFVSVVGQVVNSLLEVSASPHIPLQRVSLRVLHDIIFHFLPEDIIPSILPGVISVSSKVALGVANKRNWANGEVVAAALEVMQDVIVKSVGDDVCLREGALHKVTDLENLADLTTESVPSSPPDTRPYTTARTLTWLLASSGQLRMAIEALSPLIKHPTPSALLALSRFAEGILSATPLALPQCQPLLVSFLLSLTNSDYPSVVKSSREGLLNLLSADSDVHRTALQTLVSITKENLAALPRLILSHSDGKVEHAAGVVEAVARLSSGPTPISSGIGVLLGATGGIEKWGWSFLSVLELVSPPITVSKTSAAQLMLETDAAQSPLFLFPEIMLRHVDTRSTYNTLVHMFHALGRAAGDACLFSIEWFIKAGQNGKGSRAVAALWCASRLLEGVAEVSIDTGDSGDGLTQRRSKRLEKMARGLARSLADVWDEQEDEILLEDDAVPKQEDDVLSLEYRSGIDTIRATVGFSGPETNPTRTSSQPMLHRAMCLRLLAITAGILQARFTPLLIHVLYPVLHSLVSPLHHLSTTALATLHFITNSTSYASPANLLLSNFDYALDSVSRRLTRRWLDVDATKVLVVLVRLVGSDVVQKAGDVVEECFDRLDEFHGYEVIVDGLIEVLGEVVKVVEMDEDLEDKEDENFLEKRVSDVERMDGFFEWFKTRNDAERPDTTDYGPSPRHQFGKTEEEEQGEGQHPTAGTEDPMAERPPTATQALTKQIVSRSIYFLTHGSPVIRARILMLLASSVPVLPASALLTSIHKAWPFILNRLSDPEPFVVAAAASLVEALSTNVGSFMFRRIWDDVWPRFRTMLAKLDAADAHNALARRGHGAVGTESAYTQSHRLYRSLMKTMTGAVRGVQVQDDALWQVLFAFRRFLGSRAHEELQACARSLYGEVAVANGDMVWLVLSSTAGPADPTMRFLEEPKWDVRANVELVDESLVEE